MHIVHVYINVKPECIERFIEATIDNARNSLQEPGISRFDFLQDHDNPTQFMLIEVYNTPDDQLRHRETNHYTVWKETVAEMMAEARTAKKYKALYPQT